MTPGLSGARTISVPESVTARLNFLLDRLGLVEHVDGALLGGRRSSTSCASGSWRSMIRAPTGGMRCSGTTSSLAEARVEALRDVAHQLEVLALVLADRHLVGAVGQHVGGLQHRVEEQRRRRRARAGPPTCRGTGACGSGRRSAVTLDEQPAQLGVLGHVALAEEDAALGIEPGGEQHRGRVVDALAQLGGVVGHRDRVQVDDAVDRLAAVLALDVLA